MSIHNYHDQEAHFSHDTDDVRHLFKSDEGKHEFKRRIEEWGRHGKSEFSIDGNNYRVVSKKGDDGKEIPSFERHH
ncbi:hypothetical protein A3A05_03075 [Candidatus Nomurabacteria bacterium RIFCSPLOWO2_01_FULL_41_12]|uniref:Uncharacterized protein n=1 Tax=Candidatus Nomurabacteria bacterium RIFCSPLOWO2_01_FULL_41_12 TaxID=1801774 RepID=A0A1F6WUZ7_9BACT|nr:MAG: hypothetical protein A3A05_03075 [Candidatus Nomurabacteria bacterium RIFCSPLOWO2_01_FULL_41_12]